MSLVFPRHRAVYLRLGTHRFRALRLVDVKNVTNGEEHSWLIALTSDDCSTPAADFSLNADMLTGSIRQTEVIKLQEHSPQIVGSVLVNVHDKQVSFSPYSEASQVKAAFEASGAVGKSVNVMRTGTCQTGFGWLVTMMVRKKEKKNGGDVRLFGAGQ